MQRVHEPQDPRFRSDVDAWNAMLAATTGVRVVDVDRDPRMYDPANFFIDNLHPNAGGQRAIESDFP